MRRWGVGGDDNKARRTVWLALELARALGIDDTTAEDQLILGALVCRLDVEALTEALVASKWRERLQANLGRLMRCLHLARHARRVGMAEPWDDPEGAVLVMAWNLSELGCGVPEPPQFLMRTPW